MKQHSKRVGTRSLVLVALISSCAFVGTAQASAATAQVSGVQSAPLSSGSCFDPSAVASYSMVGGLVGCWYTDTFNVRGAGQPSGTIQARGTEQFVGCLDLNNDQACGGSDPEGTLNITYQFSGKLDPVTFAEIHGRCQHPIISGTGDFTGASGVITFHDDVATGTAPYSGHVIL